jgi:LPS-assembly protein
VTITLEKYAVVRNSVLKVKGVPLFYMPVFYYPVQEDDRATGFLIPAYGTSTVRGQSLSNAFFWAISRSQDATFFHDWYSKTGQGAGGEYRYVAAPGSEGSVRTYFLKERETVSTDGGGTETVRPGRESYELRGRFLQRLPGNLRARGDVDYFSDVTVQQIYQTNLYEASLRQRSYGGNVSWARGGHNVSGTYALRELFYNDDQSTLYGSAPRINYVHAPRRMFGAPVYFAATGELNRQVQTNRFNEVEQPFGLTRADVSPQVRVPLSRWPFLGLQGTVTWRNTFYSEQLDTRNLRVPEWLTRRFLEMRADVTGPTFTRIFDTRTGFAERIKHVIEPNFSIQRTTLIENYDRIVKLEAYDFVFGGTTRMNYGVTNRFLARRAGADAQSAVREFVTVSASQTYYSDARASQVDPAYGSSFIPGREPRALSPWLVNARFAPNATADAGLRLEYDQYENQVVSMGASGRYGYGDVFNVNSGWSRRRYSETQVDSYWHLDTSIRGLNGRLGGVFAFDYDFRRGQMLQRRLQGFYNAQCCGIAMEFQTYNFPQDPRFVVPRDRRFNVTFTLAGIGTFSNVFGIFGNADAGRQR